MVIKRGISIPMGYLIFFITFETAVFSINYVQSQTIPTSYFENACLHGVENWLLLGGPWGRDFTVESWSV